MSNATYTVLRSVGQNVWEIRIMGETAGDTLFDVPFYRTKKHRVYGVFTLTTTESFQHIGTATQGDASFYCKERIAMTSQFYHDDLTFEIAEEIPHNPLYAGNGWIYILRKTLVSLTAEADSFLLQENGDYLLQENGDRIVL